MVINEIKSINDIPQCTQDENISIAFISDGDVVGSASWTIYTERNTVRMFDSWGNKTDISFNESDEKCACLLIKNKREEETDETF